VAMRTGSSTINYLLGDHSLTCVRDRLGITAITTDSSGSMSAEIRYYPWGTERYNSGTTPTTFHFTNEIMQTLQAGRGWKITLSCTGMAPGGCGLRIPLAVFSAEIVSFTYGDTFPALRHQDGKPYRGQVYTLAELPALIEQYGLPQDWNAKGEHGPDRYIEAQVWADEPLEPYLGSKR
jgi:hypothetical protein